VEAKGGSCSGSAGTDQLPNTPRSKHSATEQRRRSKINDRWAGAGFLVHSEIEIVGPTRTVSLFRRLLACPISYLLYST
jgi:hypothetical protein